jgi:diaminopimelate decarboxylase
VDAAMNDLLRPALYQSFHAIEPVIKTSSIAHNYAVVGPVCESGDFFATDRSLSINAGELLAIKDTGAYGFSMSSNYNSRPRCAEVLIDGAQMHLIRARETIEDLWRGENIV